MRVKVASLCVVLVLHAQGGAAEPRIPASSVRAERTDSAGLERAWPPRASGPQLVHQDGDAAATSGGAASSDGPAVSGAADVYERLIELDARSRRIRRGWPIAGVVTGTLMSVGGIVTLSVIKATCRDDPWFSDDPPETRCQGGSVDGKWAAGGVTVATGLILTGVSAWILAKRNRERRAIRREIRELERGRAARAASSWQLGFDAGEVKTVRIGWRF